MVRRRKPGPYNKANDKERRLKPTSGEIFQAIKFAAIYFWNWFLIRHNLIKLLLKIFIGNEE